MLTVNYINTVLYNAINTRIREHSQYEQAVEDVPRRSTALKTRRERIENAATHRVRRAGTPRTPSRKILLIALVQTVEDLRMNWKSTKIQQAPL